MATDTTTLLQWLINLLNDDHARQDFLRNPDQYLHDHGRGDVTAGDLYDSLCLLSDGGHHGHRDHGISDDDHPAPHHHQRGEDAGHYLREYITNNYTYVDDRDTNIDNSTHQMVDTGGGNFDQHIDNHTAVASGSGSTAIGGDNTGNVSSAGHDNTTAFGHGDASNTNMADTKFGSGSSVNVGAGSSAGHAEANTNLQVSDSFHAENNDSAHYDDAEAHTDDHTGFHHDLNPHHPSDFHDDGVHPH